MFKRMEHVCGRPRDGVHPNDCVELRWGAPAKSDEASTCKRYAPAAQREKMSKYRAWFHERRRPPRA
jgi:hypothetical protein